MTRNEALLLGRAEGADFEEFRVRASEIRDRSRGKAVSYSRKVFVPLTNMCRDACGYCVFVQKPGSPTARYLTPDEVIAVARNGRELGCKEVLFSLGEKPELRYAEARRQLQALGYTRTIDYLRDMCARVIEETGLLPHANPGAMTEEEIALLRPVTASMGMMLESASDRLMRPGEAHHGCPDKRPGLRLETIENAGKLRVPFTTGILIGIGETWEERVDALFAINDLHREYGHIQEVIVQNFRAKPGIAMADHPEPGTGDMVRTIAAARLILDPSISVQAPPNLNDDYLEYVSAGINDWGGISPLTIDFINPERAWPQIENLRRGVESIGFELTERLTVYPEYLRNDSEFIDSGLAPNVRSLADRAGLALHPIAS